MNGFGRGGMMLEEMMLAGGITVVGAMATDSWAAARGGIAAPDDPSSGRVGAVVFTRGDHLATGWLAAYNAAENTTGVSR
ncbi:hypothetical protein [Streptomyces sp. NPDC005322]|uniref:hypothetical protein n=1 Tax=unclassified Streptomyces TaxID=2593676 RepID=UPI0033A2EEF1